MLVTSFVCQSELEHICIRKVTHEHSVLLSYYILHQRVDIYTQILKDFYS
jgi:hypothetical protein